MKTRFFVLGLLMLFLGAQAQPIAPSVPLDAQVERARIQTERARAQASFEKDEASCYQRFAVNDCLREVKVRRRAVMEELRRQEVILNDLDRKKRAAEQIRRTDEKASAQALQDEADKRAAARQAHDERLKRAAQKKNSPGGNESGQGVVGQPRASVTDSPSAASRAQEKKAFDEKQLKAQEHRAERDKAQAEKTGPPTRTLPLPP